MDRIDTPGGSVDVWHRPRSGPGREPARASGSWARSILSSYLGIAPERVLVSFRCGACGEPHGKPFLAERRLFFNLSHSGDAAVLAVADREVGVDIERLEDRPALARLAERWLTPQEHAAFSALEEGRRLAAFLRCWTRKEALAKATGRGMTMPFPRVELGFKPAPVAAVDERRNWTVVDLPPVDGLIGAVALAM